MDVKVGLDAERNSGSTKNWRMRPSRSPRRRHRPWPLLFLGLLTFFALGSHLHLSRGGSARRVVKVPVNAADIQARCENLKLAPGPPQTFNQRTSSDRFVEGTRSTLVKNATIWTGGVNGLEIVKGDILLDKGLIKAVGLNVSAEQLADVNTIDAKGAWVTPGYVYVLLSLTNIIKISH